MGPSPLTLEQVLETRHGHARDLLLRRGVHDRLESPLDLGLVPAEKGPETLLDDILGNTAPGLLGL